MIAYFYKGDFFGVWQDQHNEDKWLERTARALGHNLNDVEARHFPISLRNDQSFLFNEEKELIIANRDEIEEMQEVEEEVETEIQVNGKPAFTREIKMVQRPVKREIINQEKPIAPSRILK